MPTLQLLHYQSPSLYTLYTTTSDGKLAHQKSNAPLTDLLLNPHDEVIVLVPSHLVRIHTLNLPKMNHTQLMKAVPFALEEQLAEPIAHLHFAISHKHFNQNTVAVISKNIMEAILADLSTVNLQANAIMPDCLCLPHKIEHWSIYQDTTHSLVRQSDCMGFSIENALLKPILQQQLKQNVDTIHCDTYGKINIDLEGITQLATAFHPVETFPFDLASLQKPSINLLQAPYKAKRFKHNSRMNYWWMAAGAALSFLVVTLLIKIMIFVVVHHKTTVIDEQVLNLFRQVYPSANLPLLEPQSRIQQALAKIESDTKQNSFLKLLIPLGQTMQQNKNLQLLHLNFQNNALTVDISANELSSIEYVSRQLQQQNITVTQNQVQPGKQKVSAQLMLTEK